MPTHRPISSGEKFGRLVVVSEGRHGTDHKGHVIYMARVKCVCGTSFDVRESSLKGGNTTSCGCKGRERVAAGLNWKHRHAYSSVYHVWQSMKSRCLNRANRGFRDYGGRGITICERWLVFANFLADMGERPVGRSLDRVNNDGDYEPENCRWATPIQQAGNQIHTKRVVYRGETMSFSQAARKIGRVPATIREFAEKNGLTHQQAIEQYRKVRRDR